MTETRLAPSTRPPSPQGSATIAALARGAGRVALVAAAALLLGGLTSPAQTFLPQWIGGFANSSGGWSILVFVVIWAVRSRPVLSAVLGAAAFVLLVEGYRMVSGWRGFYYDEPFQNEFTIVGLLVGPVIGISAAMVRSPSATWRMLAVVPLSTVLVGEGLYGLVVLGQGLEDAWWVLEMVFGAAFLAWGAVSTRRSAPVWVPAAAAGAVVLASVLLVVAYTALPRLLM